MLDIKFISTIIGSVNGYMDLQFLGGWTVYFVLGYYIQKHKFTQKEKRLVYLGTILAIIFTFLATVVYSMNYGETMGVLSYEYPNIVMFGIGVMVFFKEEVSRISMKHSVEKLIVNISRLTFGIYLIHVLLLKIWYAVGVNIQICHPLFSVPMVALLVFITGAIIIWEFRKIPVIGTYLA